MPSHLQQLGCTVVAVGKISHYEHTSDYGLEHLAHAGTHKHAAIPATLRYLAGCDGNRRSASSSGRTGVT